METENIKDALSDILGNNSMAEKLVNGLDTRQRQTLLELPKYFWLTFWISIGILILGFSLQVYNKSLPQDQVRLLKSLQNPTIGGVMSAFFTLVAYIVNSLFAVWALSFIPYISLRAYQVSTKVVIPLRLNSSKWIQLFAATFFPILLFAIVSSNVDQVNNALIIQFTSTDAIIIFVGSLAVWGILWITTHYIPLKYIVIHLSTFSILLYATIFLVYILGYGTVTYAAVIGILLFLMFSFNKLGEIARRVSIYDIDNSIADKIMAVSSRENAIKVTEAEIDVRKLENVIDGKMKKLNNEDKINEQLQKIRETSISFNNRVNETKLDAFNQKLEFLNQLYTILSEEYKLKVDQELPQMIQEFKQNVKNLSQKELSNQMQTILNHVNVSIDTIPLDNLKLEMRKASKELKQATEELANEPE